MKKPTKNQNHLVSNPSFIKEDEFVKLFVAAIQQQLNILHQFSNEIIISTDSDVKFEYVRTKHQEAALDSDIDVIVKLWVGGYLIAEEKSTIRYEMFMYATQEYMIRLIDTEIRNLIFKILIRFFSFSVMEIYHAKRKEERAALENLNAKQYWPNV